LGFGWLARAGLADRLDLPVFRADDANKQKVAFLFFFVPMM
jgi:hypothetical protein